MTSASEEDLHDHLKSVIDRFDCRAGTLHRLDGDLLHLVSHVHIPDAVLQKIDRIPVGKGMAGAAAAREEPVQVCNLQTDDTDVAEDGARETGMAGSIAVPVFDEDGSLKGSLGIAKAEPYEFSDEECERLLEAAGDFAPDL